jgi:hypothetical protein
MDHFIEQQVHEIEIKQGLEPNQTFQQERHKPSTKERGTQKGIDPRPDRPRDNPQVFGLDSQDVDEDMTQQQDAIIKGQTQQRQQEVAPLFRETLAENYPTWPATYMARRDSISGASSSGTTTAAGASFASFTSIQETAGEASKVVQIVVKNRVGRPTNAAAKARVDAKGEGNSRAKG